MGTTDKPVPLADGHNDSSNEQQAIGPDEIGFYTFFIEGQGNLPDLMSIEDDQLQAIQSDLCARLIARDQDREKAVADKLHKLEQKHKFANAEYLRHFTQVSELLELTVKRG